MRSALIILVLSVTALTGCVTSNRDRYVELHGVITKRDGTSVSGVPIRVFLRSDWRSMIGAGIQDLFPIGRASSDETGHVTCLLEDFYAYTIVAGENWQTWVPMRKKEVIATANEPLRIFVP
jgi:hypothetical protein